MTAFVEATAGIMFLTTPERNNANGMNVLGNNSGYYNSNTVTTIKIIIITLRFYLLTN